MPNNDGELMFVGIKIDGVLEQALTEREAAGFTKTHIVKAALWQYLHLDERVKK